VVHRANVAGEGGDRLVVCDVDILRGDVAGGVGALQFGLVSTGYDDARAFRLRKQGDCTGKPAAASDHHDCLVPQRITHRALAPRVW
jgi:hypothetical protein